MVRRSVLSRHGILHCLSATVKLAAWSMLGSKEGRLEASGVVGLGEAGLKVWIKGLTHYEYLGLAPQDTYRPPFGKLWVRSHTPQMPGTARAIPAIPFSSGPSASGHVSLTPCLPFSKWLNDFMRHMKQTRSGTRHWLRKLSDPRYRPPTQIRNRATEQTLLSGVGQQRRWVAAFRDKIRGSKQQQWTMSSMFTQTQQRSPGYQALSHAAASPNCPAEWQNWAIKC
jgi:hypothetical protein